MAAPTKPAYVKKVLANPEPSTHGTKRTCGNFLSECPLCAARSGHSLLPQTGGHARYLVTLRC